MKAAIRFHAASLLLAAAIVSGCGGQSSGNAAPPPVTPPASQPQTADCTATNPKCPALTINNDPVATLPGGGASPVQGYADPSLRRDPASNTLWMGYSWLHPDLTSQGAVRGAMVDTHLARSDDGGNTWNFITALHQAVPGALDQFGRSGHINSETVSLAPRQTTTGTTWYASRMVYFTPDGGSPQITSFTMHVAAASSPEALGAADEAVLGGDLTDPYWKPDFNLASLSSDLHGCTFFDAGILYAGGRLNMAVQCSLYVSGSEDTAHEFIALFSTQPDGPPRSWTWNYVGKLATSADSAALVPKAQMLQQSDLAIAQDGTTLLIVTPSAPVAGNPLTQHFGCYALEIASLDSGKLARDSNQVPRVRAIVTASDLAEPQGTTASCGYDAASASGMVIARRYEGSGLRSTLSASGLKP